MKNKTCLNCKRTRYVRTISKCSRCGCDQCNMCSHIDYHTIPSGLLCDDCFNQEIQKICKVCSLSYLDLNDYRDFICYKCKKTKQKLIFLSDDKWRLSHTAWSKTGAVFADGKLWFPEGTSIKLGSGYYETEILDENDETLAYLYYCSLFWDPEYILKIMGEEIW